MSFSATAAENVRQYNQPGNRLSLPASYLGTQTLPHPKGKRYGRGQGQNRRSVDDLDTTVSSQPGYLESIFKKESEVYKTMSGETQESDHESVESIEEQKQNVRKIAKEYTEPIQESYDYESVESIEEQKQNVRKIAKEYTEPIQESYDSDSEGSVDLTFPKVKRKSDSGVDSKYPSDQRLEQLEGKLSSSSRLNNLSPDMDDGALNSSHSSVLNNDNKVRETSFPESSKNPVYHNQRPDSLEKLGHMQMNGEDGDKKDSMNHIKKKIAPEEKFSFGMSPDKPEPTQNGIVRRRSKKERSKGMGKYFNSENPE